MDLKENQYDAFPCLKCRDCKHCNVKADLDGESASNLCPINHKDIKISKPWFASYDVGNCPICKNFEPKKTLKWLYERWEGLDRYFKDREICFKEDGLVYIPPKQICIIFNDNFDIRYAIPYEDYFNCNVDTSKWIYKSYFKRDKSSPLGYSRVTEYREV